MRFFLVSFDVLIFDSLKLIFIGNWYFLTWIHQHRLGWALQSISDIPKSYWWWTLLRTFLSYVLFFWLIYTSILLIILIWNDLLWLLWVKKSGMKWLHGIVFDILYHGLIIQKTYITLDQRIHLFQYDFYLVVLFRFDWLRFVLFNLRREWKTRSTWK